MGFSEEMETIEELPEYMDEYDELYANLLLYLSDKEIEKLNRLLELERKMARLEEFDD